MTSKEHERKDGEYGFSSPNNQLNDIIKQFELLSELDKRRFLDAATILMTGLRAQSA